MDKPKELYLCILQHDDGTFKMVVGCFNDKADAERYADGSPRIVIYKQTYIKNKVMANEIIHLCYECVFLTSDVIGRWICTRPDGTGNYKAHPYVGACSEHFKPKSKNENKKEDKL